MNTLKARASELTTEATFGHIIQSAVLPSADELEMAMGEAATHRFENPTATSSASEAGKSARWERARLSATQLP